MTSQTLTNAHNASAKSLHIERNRPLYVHIERLHFAMLPDLSLSKVMFPIDNRFGDNAMTQTWEALNSTLKENFLPRHRLLCTEVHQSHIQME